MILTHGNDIDITDNFDQPLDAEQITDFFRLGGRELHSAVVSLSGGMDSTVALALAVATFNPKNIHAVSFNYGQRHASELSSARAIAAYYSIKRHTVIDIPRVVLEGFGSPLVESDVEVKNQTYQEMINETGMAQTVVPNRNMILLSLATAYAMSNKLDSVWIGAHAEDARNFAYSDCTAEFNQSLGEAISISSYGKVSLLVPFQEMSKGDVVKLGNQLVVPFGLTMSCYRGTDPACGLCPTCSERKAAFEYAGVKDQIEYEV